MKGAAKILGAKHSFEDTTADSQRHATEVRRDLSDRYGLRGPGSFTCVPGFVKEDVSERCGGDGDPLGGYQHLASKMGNVYDEDDPPGASAGQ
jgi:hypothetical protein